MRKTVTIGKHFYSIDKLRTGFDNRARYTLSFCGA